MIGQAARTNTLLTPFARLSSPDLREAMHALLDGSVESIASGWPRLVSPATGSTWLRGSDVVIELTALPQHAEFELALVLTAASATRVVERLLGAPTETGVASALGAPSEVECGLLAYVAARLCAAWESGLSLREVRRSAESLPRSDALLWPLSISTNFGALQCSLVLAPELAARLEPIPLTVALTDRLAPGTSLGDVRVGDLLLSDRWLLSATTEGLCGQVHLSVAGTSNAFVGTIERGEVRARTATTLEDELMLVIAERPCSLLELASLASGGALPITASATVTLRRGEQAVARGEFVRERGRVGVRVHAVMLDADAP